MKLGEEGDSANNQINIKTQQVIQNEGGNPIINNIHIQVVQKVDGTFAGVPTGNGEAIDDLLKDYVMLNIRGKKLTVGKALLRKV